MTHPRATYNDFQAELFELIQLEGEARHTRDRYGFQNHYDASESFPFVVALAYSLSCQWRRGEVELTEPQKTAVSFVLHIDSRRFNHFLQSLNGRYYVAGRFYPLSVEEYCYKRRDSCPLLEWTSETFPEAVQEVVQDSSQRLTWKDVLTASYIAGLAD